MSCIFWSHVSPYRNTHISRMIRLKKSTLLECIYPQSHLGLCNFKCVEDCEKWRGFELTMYIVPAICNVDDDCFFIYETGKLNQKSAILASILFSRRMLGCFTSRWMIRGWALSCRCASNTHTYFISSRPIQILQSYPKICQVLYARKK